MFVQEDMPDRHVESSEFKVPVIRTATNDSFP